MQVIVNLLNQYGYIVLFIALLLELIAFPLPGEALMTYCGYIAYEHKMNWPLSILIAAAGVISGITVSYFIGRKLGMPFFEKYGHYVHIDKKKLDKVSIWFDKYGNKLLLLAYFVPGVRHITGYFSGITNISYKKFAVNAYIGALIWAGTFISLGKILGGNWEKYHNIIKSYALIIAFVLIAIVLVILLYKQYREKINEFVLRMLNNGLKMFHSLGKVKVLVAGAAVVFLTFSALVIGVVQDYLDHEFAQFDEITRYIVVNIFDENFQAAMKVFKNLASMSSILIVVVITLVWIYIRAVDKLHEIRFLAILLLGVWILNSLFTIGFHRVGPTGTLSTFPSRESFVTTAVYGFLAYLMTRHSKEVRIRTAVIFLVLAICIANGLSMVYYNMEYPSDVIAGYEFGGVWLSLNIILMEIFRVLPKINIIK